MFSRRARWDAPLNRLAVARAQREREGGAILDLTASNPTRAGIAYPDDELAEAMAAAARSSYDPRPLGLDTAREAVAASIGCDPADVVITASTSESYSFLFKLLTDPGDVILSPAPTYPLLDHLAALEQVTLRAVPLQYHWRWELEPHRLHEALTPEVRAIVVVSPNNPTGSFVTPAEQRMLASAGRPIIADEVFRDYAFIAAPSPIRGGEEVLTFSLGGLSKSAGLPHYKLGWIGVSGPLEDRRRALAALELIADNFLSVSTPVQVALPELLRIGATIRESIRQRIAANLRQLEAMVREAPAVSLLPVEGGWSAVLRVPRVGTDEELALQLLDRGVLVHPGYFFDFATDGYLVVSLLTRDDEFREGMGRLLEVVHGRS